MSIEKIKTRGYWEIVIHPSRFVERRVANILDLREIVRTRQVAIRGWSFPHYGRDEPQVRADHIVQEVDFLAHVESWRLYQSGMFVYLGGYRIDWAEQDTALFGGLGRPAPGTGLGVADTIWILTEAFEFAARLALTEAGDDRMRIAATAHDLSGRVLQIELPGRDLPPRFRLEGLDALPQAGEFSREKLAAEAKIIALDWAREVFRRFGWDASSEVLREIQIRAG